MSEQDQTANRPFSIRRFGALVPWVGGLGLTYGAGKMAVDLAKWLVLIYQAPGGEAKLILAGYLFSALMPVLLLAIPAFVCWRRLIRSEQRSDAVALLALEIIFLLYFDFRDLQRSLADFSMPA